MIALYLLYVLFVPVDEPAEPETDCVAWECFADAQGQWSACRCVAHEGSLEL